MLLFRYEGEGARYRCPVDISYFEGEGMGAFKSGEQWRKGGYVEVHFVLTANLAAYRQAEACYV